MFQALRWWGAGKKLGRLPCFFPLVLPFAIAAYDLTCSLLSERLEQIASNSHTSPISQRCYGRTLIFLETF